MKSKSVNLTFVLLGVALLLFCAVAAATLNAQEMAPDAKPKPTPSPALWAVNSFGTSATPNLSIFQGTRLGQKTSAVSSAHIIANAIDALLDGMTFDRANDLWMSFCATTANTTGYIAELSAAALRHLINTGGGQFTTVIEDPSAAVTKNPPPVEYLTCPSGLLFDASGNLWVETAGGSDTSALPALLEYASEDLIPGKHLLQSPPAATIIENSHYSGKLESNPGFRQRR